MLVQDAALALGSPRFLDPRLAQLAADHGDLNAWREAFAHLNDKAACAVTGDFAVGLSAPDGRSFLAVDRFAIRSLCYRVQSGQLRFAARADALADAGTGTAAEIDPQAIYDYLYFHVIPSPRTIYKDIFRLPPGHYALFEHGQLTVAPYWVPEFKEDPSASLADWKDEFRQVLQSAVAQQLGGSQPACFLSGGTDSSTIAGMAALASGQTVASYSIGFDAPGYDEMAYAQLAARHFKTEHHAYYVTPDDLVQGIPRVAAYFDQPFGNSSALPAYYCAHLARQDGVGKLLAGDGGDELFGGNTRYAKNKLFGLYDHLPTVLQKGLLEPVLATRAAAAFALTRKAASYVEQARLPLPDRLQLLNLLSNLGAAEVLSPQLLALCDVGAPLRLQQSVWHSVPQSSPLNRALAYDWRFTLAESDLPKVVGAAGLAGIDVGFPMLDDRVLAFSQKLPSQHKLKGLQLRWFFKEALRGFLPPEILTKKKQGFGLPFGVWANSHPPLKKLASDSLYALAERGVVRPEFAHTLLTQRLAQHPGYFGEMVWILMMLSQWLSAKAPGFHLKR
jgi:asparagine synthase (glutamine-hydrolysing)